MKTIKIKSPTRVDLAGGTLDLWPLFSFVGKCQTINLAISVWSEVELTPHTDGRIEIISEDVKLKAQFSNLKEFLADTDPKLKLYQILVEFMNPAEGFTLKTRSESPVGAGLGGSSSLMVSMLKAFSTLTGRTWKSVHDLVHVAHNLEARILTTPTGTQDYYPAASGGLNVLTYSPEGITQDVQKIKGSEMEEAFLLVYTGRSHHSGLNNFEVLKGAVGKDEKVLGALRDLQKVSHELVNVLKQKNYSLIPDIFEREYKARIQLTSAFTSPEIEKLRNIAIQHHSSIKICGAGGGGCVLIWAPQNKQKVADECQKAGFQIMNAVPVDPL